MDVLSIPTVLTSVLNNLSTRFLMKVCRLVNSTWNHEVCKILNRRVIVDFTTLEKLELFCETFSAVGRPLAVPSWFSSFRFGLEFYVPAIENRAFGTLKRLHEAMQRFTGLMGKSVLQLEVCLFPVYSLDPLSQERSTSLMYEELVDMLFCRFSNVRYLKVLLFMSTNEVPEDFNGQQILDRYAGKVLSKLENIFVDVVSSHESYVSEVPLLLKTLFQAAIHLKRVLPLGDDNRCVEKVLKESIVSSFASFSNSLQEINILLPVNDEDLRDLCTYRLSSVCSLRLEIDTDSVTYETLLEFFVVYGGNLKCLHLGFSNASYPQLKYPQIPLGAEHMSRLTTLTLINYKGSLTWNQLPKLRKLVMSYCNVNDILSRLSDQPLMKSTLQREVIAMPHFDELIIGKGCQPWTDYKLEERHRFIRNLTCLSLLSTLHISHFLQLPLTQLFEHCVKLKELSLLKCGGIMDDAMCGIRDSILRKVCQTDAFTTEDFLFPKYVGHRVAQVNSQVVLFRESAFIGNLKDLHNVELEGDFSDASILYGILHCKRLRSVCLHSHHLTWRTSKLLTGILTDLINVKIVCNGD